MTTIRILSFLEFLAISLFFCSQQVGTSPLTLSVITNLLENSSDGVNSRENITPEKEPVDIKNENVRESMEIENKMKRKMLSKFELCILRCCSSNRDTKVGRCFEVNGFGGIHFLRRPCQLLQVVLEKE